MGEAKRRRAAGDVRPKGKRSRLPAVLGALVGVVVIVGLYYWLTTPTVSPLDDLPTAGEGTPAFPAELDRFGVSRGDPDAPVVVREFADYQCPACARFAASVERLFEEYVEPGQVRYVFFDFPLRQHDNAVPAALAARCAGDQDAYWPMHVALYEGQDRWSGMTDPLPVFLDYARGLELKTEVFRRCMTTGRHRADVQRSLEVARQLRISSTPTVFVGNVQLTRPGWYQLAGVVERQLGP